MLVDVENLCFEVINMEEEELTNLEAWARHLVNRFGKKKMKKFTESLDDCPCSFLDRACWSCKHKDRPHITAHAGCHEALVWASLSPAQKIGIKKRITLL